jgi:hypothetical protein
MTSDTCEIPKAEHVLPIVKQFEECAAGITITIITMSAEMHDIKGFRSSDLLRTLRERAEELLCGSKSVRATLCMDGNRFFAEDENKSLEELGIFDGQEILCVTRQSFYDVCAGMRVAVSGAGLESVNGTYTAKKDVSGKGNLAEVYKHLIGEHIFAHDENPSIVIKWYAACIDNHGDDDDEADKILYPAGW